MIFSDYIVSESCRKDPPQASIPSTQITGHLESRWSSNCCPQGPHGVWVFGLETLFIVAAVIYSKQELKQEQPVLTYGV